MKDKKYTIPFIFFNLLSLLLLAYLILFVVLLFTFNHEPTIIKPLLIIGSIITFLSIAISIFQYARKKYKSAILLSLIPTLIFTIVILSINFSHIIDIINNPSDYTFGDLD